MDTKAVERYADVMAEVKLRGQVFQEALQVERGATFRRAAAESACLQLRMILELIAFASLIANKKEYAARYSDFASHWNARLLMRDLERLNPQFYPQPILEYPSPDPGIKFEWRTPEPKSYMNRDEFLFYYEKCGALLHAQNPFKPGSDLGFYEKNLEIWIKKVVGLLNKHIVHLNGQSNIYLIQMNASGRPMWTLFGAVKPG